MQLQSVSSQNFGYNNSYSRENIDKFINLSDRQIQYLAKAVTDEHLNEKRHRKINKAVLLGTPVVAGIASAVLKKGKNADKLLYGLKNFAGWAGCFAVIDLAYMAMRGLRDNSKSIRKFEQKQPFISTMLQFLAAYGAVETASRLANKGGKKYLEYLTKHPKKKEQILEPFNKFTKKLNANKILNKIGEKAKSLKAKMPKSLKTAGKYSLAIAPFVLCLGAFLNVVNHASKRNRTLVGTYVGLKNKQAELAAMRTQEILNQQMEEKKEMEAEFLEQIGDQQKQIESLQQESDTPRIKVDEDSDLDLQEVESEDFDNDIYDDELD
ncbi:hypothetical protein IJF81_02385 [bacterium]|nr:hypothetical protein [bacterium]